MLNVLFCAMWSGEGNVNMEAAVSSEQCVDVTVPLQFLVNERSLHIFSDESKVRNTTLSLNLILLSYAVHIFVRVSRATWRASTIRAWAPPSTSKWTTHSTAKCTRPSSPTTRSFVCPRPRTSSTPPRTGATTRLEIESIHSTWQQQQQPISKRDSSIYKKQRLVYNNNNNNNNRNHPRSDSFHCWHFHWCFFLFSQMACERVRACVRAFCLMLYKMLNLYSK